MASIKWENSRKGKLTSNSGMTVEIHIKKPKGLLNYKVHFDGKPTLEGLTIQRCRELAEEYFDGVK